MQVAVSNTNYADMAKVAFRTYDRLLMRQVLEYLDQSHHSLSELGKLFVPCRLQTAAKIPQHTRGHTAHASVLPLTAGYVIAVSPGSTKQIRDRENQSVWSYYCVTCYAAFKQIKIDR